MDTLALNMLTWVKLEWDVAADKKLLMSMLFACQWLVHDAIMEGLTPQVIQQAKDNAVELSVSLFRFLKAKAAS